VLLNGREGGRSCGCWVVELITLEQLDKACVSVDGKGERGLRHHDCYFFDPIMLKEPDKGCQRVVETLYYFE
jgi:hypothetical protein